MKSVRRMRSRVLIGVVCGASLMGCESSDAVDPASFSVTPKTVEMRVGESVLLVATASEPLEVDPQWTSLDPGSATVDALGRVLARAQGGTKVVATAAVGSQTLTDTATVSVITGCPTGPSISALYVSGATTLVRPDAVAGAIDVAWGGACAGTSTVQRVDLIVADSVSERSVAQTELPQPIPAGWSAPNLTFNSLARNAAGVALFPSGPYQLKIVWTFTNPAAGTSAAAIPIRVRNP
jgi:hypothetical protein